MKRNGKTLSILVLEPFYGGSHKAFLDAWTAGSRHEWTILGLPDTFWRWRMRHSALYFSEKVTELVKKGQKWDLVFCSSMLNLAEFKGLAPELVRKLPHIVYFHENQLTYPISGKGKQDPQAVLNHISTCFAADKIWFNSKFNRDSFLGKLPDFLGKMPDYQPFSVIDLINKNSKIQPLGIENIPEVPERAPGYLRILWAARWEKDKNPEDFFKAINILKTKGAKFRISVIGETFTSSPKIFKHAKRKFGDIIDRWGYQESREEYVKALQEADIIVSTAIHEFFGISILEAASGGAYPLVPERLAYPEIFSDENGSVYKEFFYDGSHQDLAEKLFALSQKADAGSIWKDVPVKASEIAKRYNWNDTASRLDDALFNSMPRQKLCAQDVSCTE